MFFNSLPRPDPQSFTDNIFTEEQRRNPRIKQGVTKTLGRQIIIRVAHKEQQNQSVKSVNFEKINKEIDKMNLEK